MDDQKLLTEGVVLEIGNDEHPVCHTRPGPGWSIPLTLTAIILLGISLFMHYSFISRSIDLLFKEGSIPLLSFLLPDFEMSEPVRLPLPEGTMVERPEKGENKVQKTETTENTGEIKVLTEDLSVKAEFGLALTNETSYLPELYTMLGTVRTALKESEIDALYTEDAPKVLIYHTHATEGYIDTAGTGFRTDNIQKNTVALGSVIASVLEEAGIETIHLTEQFDKDDWSMAYENSHSRVIEILKEYPSIQYVFDVHRDCIGDEKNGYVRAAAIVNGRDTAQLMFVCGTDEGGSSHTEWRSNLSFALALQSSLYSEYPSLMRPLNLRRASFYQDTSPQALILECGTCASTLNEAKRGAVYFAIALADYIKGEPSGLSSDLIIESICP